MRRNVLRFALLVSVMTFGCLSLRADETNTTLTVDGVTYSNVTFRTATPYAVSIRHDHGITSVPLAKLSPELQQRFGYDPNKATQFRTAQVEAIAKGYQAEADAYRKKKAEEAAQQQLEAASLSLRVTVIQALKDGAICEAAIARTKTVRRVGSANVSAYRANVPYNFDEKVTEYESLGTIHISGTPSLYDNQTHCLVCVPNGDYDYTTVQGAYKKVRSFMYLRSFDCPQQ